MRPRLALLALVGLALVLMSTPAAEASPGQLDPSFGDQGHVLTPVGRGGGATAIALEPNGKVLAGGWSWDGGFTLARYLPGGALDRSFGTDGVTTTAMGSNAESWAYALALQPDGKAILAGRVLAASSGSFALARYTTSGSLDPTFGNGGKVFTSVGQYSGAWALSIQPDGKIIAGGESWNGDFALVRYNPDGSLDRSFGTNGIATTPFPGSLES